MKTLLALLTFAFTTATSLAIPENLLINGDFGTGTLAPWTASGTVSVLVGAAFLQGISSIDQVVTTKAGGHYYLAGSAAAGSAGVSTEFVARATPAAGGAPDTAFAFQRLNNFFRRFSGVFTATTTSTRISLSIEDNGISGFADNFVLYELVAPSRFAGVYSGTVNLELKTDAGARTKSMTSASAEIDEDGKVILLEGTARVHGGILFDDDTSDFFFAGQEHTEPLVALKGKTLSLSFEETLTPSLDEGNNALATMRTLKFKLKRKAR